MNKYKPTRGVPETAAGLPSLPGAKQQRKMPLTKPEDMPVALSPAAASRIRAAAQKMMGTKKK